MKAKYNKQKNCYEINKGSINIEIYNGTDIPKRPVKIKYENALYDSKLGLIDSLKAFEKAYSEEQVLEIIFEIAKI